jgi:hypothetical protein
VILVAALTAVYVVVLALAMLAVIADHPRR